MLFNEVVPIIKLGHDVCVRVRTRSLQGELIGSPHTQIFSFRRSYLDLSAILYNQYESSQSSPPLFLPCH
jgi:hypothetical protein